MHIEQLFWTALKLEEPIYIKQVEFLQNEGVLHLHIAYRRGAKFSCSDCLAVDLDVHDTRKKTWRHLDFWQYKTYIHMRAPRVKCSCGVKLWTPPWATPNSGFTLLFERYVMVLANDMSISNIAGMLREYDGRIWRVVKRNVERLRSSLCFSDIKKIGMDETSSRRGHNYITVFVDMETNKVLFATQGKSADTIDKFIHELYCFDGCAYQIDEVAVDMSPAFTSGIKTYLPKANINYNRFHVEKQMNSAVDEVRKAEQKNIPELKNSRFAWLKKPENLTVKQAEKLESLNSKNLKTGRAWRIKEALKGVYQTARTAVDAAEMMKRWLSWAVRSRLEPVKKVANMIKNHLNGVLRFFDTRLTTGVVEGINSRIQEIKRRAKGFRNIENFITMIYLVAGYIDMDISELHPI
jgi:transposase